jgi:primosomal protein N' (replication factor Y)
MRVFAPFRGRRTAGVVLTLTDVPAVSRILALEEVPDLLPLLDRTLLDLMSWVSEQCCASLGQTLRAIVPTAVLNSPAPLQTPPRWSRPPALVPPGTPPWYAPGVTPPPAEDGTGWAGAIPPPAGALGLEGGCKADVLEGIVTSLAPALHRGEQALFLVPEIAPAFPLALRLERDFPGRVLLLHAHQPDALRRHLWHRSLAGDFAALVGTRQAVFAPLPRPAALVVTGEHDPSYKSEESPRYHARDAAWHRAQLSGAPLLLLSASLSLETRHRLAGSGGRLIRLGRTDRHPRLPGTRVADLGRRLGRSPGFLSGELIHGMRRALDRRLRVMLLVNRRGTAAAVFCGDCHFYPPCPRCRAALALQDDGLAVCRLCGHREEPFLTCPRCGGTRTRPGSPGTQGVEKEVLRRFPGVPVTRIDGDSLARVSDWPRVLGGLGAPGPQVLVGTHLLAGGCGLPGVGMAALVDADIPLHRPDFRAAERLLQEAAEAMGQLDPLVPDGLLVIQSRQPDHPALTAFAAGEAEAYLRGEEEVRREAGFPPFADLVLLTAAGSDPVGLEEVCRGLADDLARLAGDGAPREVLGPFRPFREKRRGAHRRQLILKGALGDAFRRALKIWRLGLEPELKRRRISLVVDAGPVDFS